MSKNFVIKEVTSDMIPDLHGLTIYTISGFKRSGKDTVALNLYKLYGRYHKGAYPFALGFAKLIHIFTDAMMMTYSNTDIKDKSNEFWSNIFNENVTQRNVMIKFSDTIQASFGEGIWNAAMLQCLIKAKSKPAHCAIISDLRFNREITFIERCKEKGANVIPILVLREKALPAWAKMGLNINDPVEYDIIVKDFKPHPSEFEWCCSNLKYKHVIYNDGKLEDLFTACKSIMLK